LNLLWISGKEKVIRAGEFHVFGSRDVPCEIACVLKEKPPLAPRAIHGPEARSPVGLRNGRMFFSSRFMCRACFVRETSK